MFIIFVLGVIYGAGFGFHIRDGWRAVLREWGLSTIFYAFPLLGVWALVWG